ncbi:MULTISPECIES: SRPBCC family protein [unclassified Pseudonocardia]|uniref:SRPBCC family protein n=1 Tax=unclassified Pseudonocardia TaxID=2619320 RepID=UPI0001FFEBDE|nr:SRPBCC family protein [Pseudonocardia sp. Ae707_Ps1]OLM19743.1 Aha1 domain protein [Pseudonocardia sp. Ae707_Ps1]
MDLTAEIRKAHRTVGGEGRTHTIVLNRLYPASPEEVWSAWTDPERLARWFEPVSGDLHEGGRYRLEDSGTVGTVERCARPRALRVTWEYEGSISAVELTLTPAGDETELELRHEVPDDEHWARFGPAAGGIGWDFSLLPLAMHLAGDPRVPAEVLEGTELGNDLTRWAAGEWAAAHEASGAGAATAKEAAGRTLEFYLA